MVEAPSSYPLIGWNLPGTSIVIPDSKAVRPWLPLYLEAQALKRCGSLQKTC